MFDMPCGGDDANVPAVERGSELPGVSAVREVASADPQPSIADLLRRSREAHARYRQAAGKIGPKGEIAQQPNALRKREAIADAFSYRHQAETADAERLDPAWQDDKGEHDALMDFYRTFLA